MPSTFDQFDAIAEPTESGGSPPDPKDKGLTPPPTSAQSMFSAFDNIAAPKVAPAQQASPFADFDKIAAPVDWIQKYSQQYNVDPDLIRAMTYRESGGNQYYKNGQIVTSPKGALGAMQLMPDTARQLGVDPNDPEQNISGGIKYMSQLLQHFGGDTEKAVAAYHAGQGAVDKAGGIPNTNDGLSTTRDYVNSIMQRYNAHRGYNPEAAVPAAPAAAPVARDQLIAQLADQSLTPDQRADLMVKLTATNRVLQTDKSYKEGEVGDWYSGTGSFYTRALGFMYDMSQAPKGILKDWIAKPLASVLPDKIDTDKDMGRWKGEAELYNGFHDLVGVIAEKRKMPERAVYQEITGGDSGMRGMAADSLKLVTDFSVSTLSDPVNWPFFFGSGIVRPALRVGVDAAFAAMMAKGAYDGFKNSAELYDSNRKPWEQSPEFYESLAEPGMNTLFAGLSVHGAREQAGLVGILKRLNEESNTRFGTDWNDLDSKQRSQLTYDMAKVDPSEDLDEAGQKLIHQAVQLGLDPDEFNSTVKARADVMQQKAQEAHDKLLDIFRNNREEAMDALREGIQPAQQFFGEGGEDINKEIAGRRQARKENAGRLMDRMIAEAPDKTHTDDALIMDALERTPEEWVQERERQHQLEAWREIQEAQRVQGRPTPTPVADQKGVDVARALALRELDDVAFHKGFDNTQRLVDALGKYDAAGVKLDPMEERLLQLAHVAGIEPQGIFRHGEPAPKAQPPDPIALLMRTSLEEVRRENNLRKAAQTMDRAAKTANSPEASDAASQAADEARKAAEVARARREELNRQRLEAMKKETEQPLGHPIDGILGNATNITIPAIGKKYAGRYKLVNLKDLTPSHVPQTAPGEWQKNDNAFQPRTDYGHDLGKQQKIIDDSQGNTFDLDQIANNNPTHDAGPAMVRSDGLVAGGNGRTMRMLLAYGNGLGEKIREQIQRVAPVFGIDPDAIPQATANYWPAIVRIFDEDHTDRATMFRVGEELNMASAAGYSEEERAVAASKRISQPQLEMISGILADKNFSIRDFMREENDFVVDLMLKSEMVPQNQRSTFINDEGKLTTAGKNLFEDAVLGKLFNSPDVIRAARNDTPSVLNKIGSSPLAALLRIKARADVWDFTPYLEDMLRLFSNIHSAGQELSDIRVTHRKNGAPVPESDVDLYLHPDRFKYTSGSVFDMRDQPSPITEALAKLFEDKTPEIAKATDEYIKAAEKGDVKDQGGFGFAEPPEPWDIFNTYIGKPNGVHVRMEDWFNNQPPPGQVLRDLGFINVREDKHGTFQVERKGNEGLTVHLKPEEVTTPEATRDLVNKKIDEKVKKGARSLDDIKKALGIAPPPSAEPEFPDGPQFTEGAYLVPPNIIDRPPHAVVEPSKADFTPVPGLKDQDGPTVFVGRHGETNLNGESGASAERIRGWKDVPLNEQGRADAKRLAEMLVGKGITHVIASDLHRTQETGRIIADRLGVPFKTDQRARPWNLGDLTGEPVATAIKDLVRYQNNPGEKVPNGEAYNDFYARFANLLQEVTDDATRNKTVPMILGHSRNMLATPHIISEGKVDIAAKGGPRPGSAIMIRAGEDGKFALADKFETEGEETRGSKPVTSEKAERVERSDKPEEQALPGETPATEGEKPKSQMVQDVEASIASGKNSAELIDWVNGEPDSRRAIAASRKEFEDAGWKWNDKEGQLEKDGWYAWYRSQGDLSSPVLQWDQLKPPPDADVLPRTELTAEEINRAKDTGRSVADTEEHLLKIRQQLDKFPNTTPEQREAVLALWRMNAEHHGMTLAEWVKKNIKGIDTETTADKLSPSRLYQELPTDIEDAIRAGGGHPRGSMSWKDTHLAFFDDPQTKSTLALHMSEVTPEAVKAHIAEHRKKGDFPMFQEGDDTLFKHDWQMLDAMADQALQRQDVVRMMKDDIRAHPHLGFDPDTASVRWYVRVILDKYIRGDEQGFSPRTVEAVLNSIAPHDLAKYQDMKREELAQSEIDALRGQLFEVQKKLKQSGFMTDDHFYLSYRQKQIREQLEELNVNPDEPGDTPERMDPQDFLFQHTTGLAPTFYNKSEKIVSEKMQGPMASKDVMAMLRNGGVKEDEIKWTGLDDFLKDHAVVSPQQMRDFIAGNSLQVTDIVKGGKKYLLDDQGRTIPDGAGGLVEKKDATKYGDSPALQTPGGTNYRELLLTLPVKSEVGGLSPTETSRFNELDRMDPLDMTEQQLHERWGLYEKAGNQARTTMFTDGHYGQEHPNVLAHVRFNDRIAPDGKKVLFLEEIQSDWHQNGRKQGYQVPLTPTEHERMMQLGGKGQLSDAEFSEHEALTMRDAGALLGRVPDAPFKNTWHELALKRMLRYAAENGYDQLAWTTGEQQAARYDLSKQIQGVVWRRDTGTLYVHKLGMNDYDRHPLATGVTEDKLEKYVGKGAAEKLKSIDSVPDRSPSHVREVTGSGLSIESPGMKGFYDKIVADFLKKYTKKWGATVEDKPIDLYEKPEPKKPTKEGAIPEPPAPEVGQVVQQNKKFYVAGRPGDAHYGPFDTIHEAHTFAEDLKQRLTATVHSIDVTPAMKDAVMHEGQPLFQGQKKGAVQFMDDGAAVIHGFQSGDVSTLVHETAHIFRRTMKPEETRMAEDWLGIENGEWLRSHEEAFARGFEKYLYEGKAPNPDMKKIFAQFKEWLKGIYQRIVGSPLNDVKLTDTARKVYANILGANDPRVEAAVRKKAIKESAKAIPEPPPLADDAEPTAAPEQQYHTAKDGTKLPLIQPDGTKLDKAQVASMWANEKNRAKRDGREPAFWWMKEQEENPLDTYSSRQISQMKAERKNVVIVQARDSDGRLIKDHIGVHDGTIEHAVKVAGKLRDKALEDPDVSNIQSQTVVTDENGKAKWTISPNGRMVGEVGTKEARYILGDLGALEPPPNEMLPATSQALRELTEKAGVEYKPEKAVLVDKAQADDLAARIREQMGMGPGPALPGMAGHIEANRESAAGLQGEELSKQLIQPPNDISRASGNLERGSDLFGRGESIGQSGLFKPPDDTLFQDDNTESRLSHFEKELKGLREWLEKNPAADVHDLTQDQQTAKWKNLADDSSKTRMAYSLLGDRVWNGLVKHTAKELYPKKGISELSVHEKERVNNIAADVALRERPDDETPNLLFAEDSGLPPKVFGDMVKLGIHHFEASDRSYTGWANGMVKTLGPWVTPYLQRIFEEMPATAHRMANDAGRRLDMSQDDRVKAFRAAKMFAQAAKILTEANQKKEIPRIIIPKGVDADETDVQSPGRIQEGRLPTAGRQPSDIQRTGPDAAPGQQESERPQRQPRAGSGDVSTKGVERPGDKPVTPGTTTPATGTDTTSKRKTVERSDVSGGQGSGEKTPKGASGRDVPKEPAVSKTPAAPTGALRQVPEARLDKPIRQRGTPVYKDDEWTAMARHYNIPENAPVPFVRLSDETRDALLPGQPEITEIMLSGLMQHDAFVGAMATGTGKTFMGSAIIKELQPEHTLILSKSQNLLGPMSERGSWSQVGMDHFGVEIKPLPKDFQNDVLEPGHYTATYARARDIKDLLARQKWDLVIADEAGEARRWYDSSQGEMLKALGNSASTDKILYLSATPFHNALELGYLERLGLWRDEGFENWAKQFGVTVSYDKDGNPSYSGGHAPRKLMKLREQLIERGQFINLDRNMDGFSAHFGIVPLTDVQKMEIKNAVKAFAMAENYFAGERPGLVRPTRAVMSTYLKNYVERARLPQAIELGKKLEQQGWRPIYFTENKAERLDVYDFMKNNIEDDAILARVRQLLPQFESTDQALQKAFGNKLANFSGPDSQERRAELKAFRNGEKTHMYASYAAGGIGVGMHDTAGDAPRAPIYIGLPWSGVMFDQATGRPWRYGTRSDVAAYFLTSDLQHEVNLVIDKIAPRLESLKALVSGVKEDPIVKSMRTINGAIEYLLGNEQTADVADFGRTIDAPITHWDQLPVRSAKDAMGPGKGLKLPEPYKRKPPNVLGQDFSEPPPPLPDSIDEAGQQAIAVAEDARHSAAAEEGLTGQGDHPDHLDWAERELRAAAGMPIAEGSQGPKPPDDIMGAAQIGPAGENVPPPKDIGFPSIAVSSMERGMPDTIAKLISRPETAVRTWVAYAHTAPYTIGKFEEGRPLAERLTKAEREKRQETADMLHTVLHEKLPEFKIKEGSTEDSQVYEALRKSQNPARELAGVVSEVSEKPYPANVLDAAQFLRDKIYDPLWERAHEVRPDFKYRKQYATIIQRLRGLDWGHPLLKGMLPQDVQQYMSLPIRRAIARNPFSPYLLPRDKNENLNFGIHETMRAYIPSLLKVIHDTPAVRDGLLMVSEVDKAEQPLLREFMERYLRHYAGVPGEYKETQSVMFRMTRSIVNANFNALLEMNPAFLGLRMMHVIQNTLPDLGPKYVKNGMTSFATADGRELLARSGVLNDMPPIKSKALQIGREILHSVSWQTEFMNRGISYLGALERAKDIGMLGDPSKVGPLSMDRLRELAADGVDVEKALDYAYDTVARNQFMYTPAYVQFQLRDHPLALQFKAWPIRTVELISNIIQNARQDRKKASLLIGLLGVEGAFGYNFLHLAVPPLVTLGAETANTLNKVLHGRATEAEIEKLFKDLAINFIPGAGYVLRKLTAKDKKQHLQE